MLNSCKTRLVRRRNSAVVSWHIIGNIGKRLHNITSKILIDTNSAHSAIKKKKQKHCATRNVCTRSLGVNKKNSGDNNMSRCRSYGKYTTNHCVSRVKLSNVQN